MQRIRTHLVLSQNCPDCGEPYPIREWTPEELNNAVLVAGRPDLCIDGAHPLANESGRIIQRLPCPTPACTEKREKGKKIFSKSEHSAGKLALEQKLHHAGIARLDAAFSNFNPGWPKSQRHKDALGKALDIVQDYAEHVYRDCLILSGPYGCGKTHLAIAAIRYFLENGGSHAFHFACLEAWSGIKASWDNKETGFRYRSIDVTESWLQRSCQQSRMLVIDDMDKVEVSAGWLSWLLPIINYRVDHALSTIFTINHKISEMQAFLCQKDQLSDKGYALWDRIIGATPRELRVQLPDIDSYRRK